MRLDQNNNIPLHIQLKEIIEQRVQDGIFFDQIPSERKFMEKYSVSRSTVRSAINLLVREGVLEKRHGKGTFVSFKPIHEWLGNLSSTSETIRRMGMRPGAKLINHCSLVPPARVTERTGFEQAYFIKRIRYADSIPIGIERHYYPTVLGEKLITYELNDATLYDLLENELGVQFAEAEQTISCGQLPDGDSAHIDIPPEHPVLIAVRVIRDQSGSVIEMEEAFYRSDMYTFNLNLSRKFG